MSGPVEAAIVGDGTDGDEIDGDGAWASRSFEESLRSALLIGLAGWQLVVVAAILASPEVDLGLLVAGHLALAVGALLARHRHLPLWIVVLAADALVLADWASTPSTDGAIYLSAAWTGNLLHFFPPMLMSGRQDRLFSALIGAVVPLGVWIVHPDWLRIVALPFAFTGLAIRWACRRSIPRLQAFTARVDDQASATWRERQAAATAGAASQRAAEQARVLHDTVINTLAAVASGGGAVADRELVQERCRQDLVALDSVLDGREVPAVLRFGALADELGLVATRHGLDDAELEQLGAELPQPVVRALLGAVGELVRNVAKHAGTGAVDLHAEADGMALTVAVEARSPGFDGRVVPGRGLAESVIARAEEVGIAVHLRADAGTEVRLVCPLDAPAPGRSPDPADEQEDFRRVVVTLRDRACWMWTAATVLIGVVIEVVNRRTISSPVYGMLGVVAVVGLLAWRDVRRRGHLGGPVTAALVASVPPAFLFALASTGFGRHDITYWQAIGVSAPLIVLLVQARSRRPLAIGVVVLVATSAAATAVAAADLPAAGAVIPVGTAAALGLVAGWTWFHGAVERVGAQLAAEQRIAAEARVERAAREAATDARRRWHEAGLVRCRSLLQQLRSGGLDAGDPRTQAVCAEEEAYLRQVTLLEPELYRMGHHFAGALARARERDVRLVVRTGEVDVEDDVAAEHLGRLLQGALELTPEGFDLTASLFSTRGEMRFGLVAPAEVVHRAESAWSPPEGWQVSVERFGERGSVEVTSARR